MYFDEFKHQLPDIDPDETADWIESFDQLVDQEGEARARFVLYKLLKRSRQRHIGLPPLTQTRYINTISPEQEPFFPGDEELERRIRRLIRWNAVAMVLRANNRFSGIGGHLSTYASSASLYEVGFNHFFRGKDAEGGGDQIYYQGHAAPGMYARAFLEGRLSEEQLDYFRREVEGKGLPSYPHPRLMPDFWEFPTVSMGLGPIAHPPGYDTLTRPSLPSSGPMRKMEERISRIRLSGTSCRSRSRASTRRQDLPSGPACLETDAPRRRSMSDMTWTSFRLGASIILHGPPPRTAAAMIGSTAFFAPLILTRPPSRRFPVIE